MKALVVDDEPLVRNEFVYMLARVASDCAVREAGTALQALSLLQHAPFDVVFLDIRMPGLSGLEALSLINRIPNHPRVVFVTAHEDHALRAFELAAFDYLLKPVTEQRLAATFERLRTAAAAKTHAPPLQGRLPVEGRGRTLLVPVSDIRYVAARGHVVSVALYDQTFRFRGTLADCEQRLESYDFMRVHRAYLVNPHHVVDVSTLIAGAYALHVDDRVRSEIPVSRNFAPAVRAAFEF